MNELLTIAPPTPDFPRELLDSEGGFLWWYADIFDAEGNGVVLIWSFGLPFLPGYADAARRGRAQTPRERPSVNVALYREGKLDAYLLQELQPVDATWSKQEWRFGESRALSNLEDGRRSLYVDLDAPLPTGERLQGTLRLEGPGRRTADADVYRSVHDWAPLTGPAHGSWDLQVASENYAGSGRAYFDGNAGATPLHDTGIHEWTWGRAPFEDREAIYYVLWPARGVRATAVGIEIDQEGELRSFSLEVERIVWRRGSAGLKYPAKLELTRDGQHWLTSWVADLLDDGPFYLRYFTKAQGQTTTVRGMGEFCRTDRIDLARHRPLVRMRVHRVDRDNSIWLPLFSGPRNGRVARLIKQWVGGRRGDHP